MKGKDAVIVVIAVVAVTALVLSIVALWYSIKAPEEKSSLPEISQEEEKVRVVGQVFFDRLNYGVRGQLDGNDIPGGAGVKIMVFEENQSTPELTEWVYKEPSEPGENGIYQFWLKPGRYYLGIEMQAEIAQVYSRTSFIPNSFLRLENTDDIVVGPIVFIYDYQYEYALG